VQASAIAHVQDHRRRTFLPEEVRITRWGTYRTATCITFRREQAVLERLATATGKDDAAN
jgi:hypothetical protein